MKIVMTQDYNEMSRVAAETIVTFLNGKNGKAVIGFATGNTPIGCYEALQEAFKKGRIDFSKTIAFNLDEYCGLEENHPKSYKQFMANHLFNHVNIFSENTHIPNGNASCLKEECERYDALIAGHGGIDLQILGIGENGHIGFNEPAVDLFAKTHVELLAELTKNNHAVDFGSKESVPQKALSMGIQTIFSAKEIILIASGKQKAKAIREMMEGLISTQCPASLLQLHPSVTVILDKAAASELNNR